MKKRTSSVLSIIIAVAMLFSGIPAFAEDSSGQLGASGISPFGIIDVTPPVLTGITLDKAEIEAPGTVTVTATAMDDVSGVHSIGAEFHCAQTGRYFYASLYDTIWNEDTYEYEHTGNFKGTIDIGDYELSGTFDLIYVAISDNAENSLAYKKILDDWDIQRGVLPLLFDISFILYNPGMLDTTPPAINSLIIDKTTVEAPGTITVTGTATDDISGVHSIGVEFHCNETGRYYYTSLSDRIWNDSIWEYEHTGIYTGTIDIGAYDLPGIFELVYISVSDCADNGQSYKKYRDQWDVGHGILPLPFESTFIVTNSGTLDITPPILNSLSIDKTSVESPGTIAVTGSASDDISGVSSIGVEFYCEQLDRYFYASLRDTIWNEETWEYEHTGYFVGTIDISVYQLPGIFELVYASVGDNAGNGQSYRNNPDQWDLEHGYLPLPYDLSFTVINDGTFDYASNTNNPDLADDIANLPDGSTVGIDYGSNSHIGADVFAAAQGRDIDIILIGNGIEWVFNGMDIDNPKDIDLSVGIAPIDQSSAANADDIRAALNGSPGVVLSFPNNGQLPGKAKIRVKADSEFRQYLGVTDLYVYYFNNQTGELEQVKANVNVTHDGYIEFEITHNSDFVITSGEVNNNQPPVNPPVNPPTNPPANPATGNIDNDSNSSGAAYNAPNPTPKPITVSQAISAYNTAYAAAKTQGSNKLIVRFRNMSTIPFEVIKAINSRAVKDGVAVTIHADVVENLTVLNRIAFDPANATKDINASISYSNPAAINAASRFKKYFSNKIAIIALGQQEPFGLPIRISSKVDITGISNPVFYAYDIKTNQYKRIASPNYSVANEYVSFTTELAGYVVVSDGELIKK